MEEGSENGQQNEYYLDEEGIPLAGLDLIEAVKARVGDTILMSFSGGKDSLATWLYLRENSDFNIIPFFMYWLPGAKFTEDSIPYYEDYFGQHIIRLPHPLFWQSLRNEWYQTPDRVAAIKAMDIPQFSFAELEDALAAQEGIDPYVAANGMRAADNIDRRNLILQKGAVGIKKRKFYYAIWDWKIDDVVDIIKRHGLKLPAEYNMWGRTVGAWDYIYVKAIRDNYPEDYKRFLEWWPLAELQIFRYEQVGKRLKLNEEN